MRNFPKPLRSQRGREVALETFALEMQIGRTLRYPLSTVGDGRLALRNWMKKFQSPSRAKEGEVMLLHTQVRFSDQEAPNS
jgi:hypothetical protein